MKNLLLLILAILLTTPLFSQNLPIPTKWKIKKIGISLGVETDMISNLDGNYLINIGKNVSATLPDGTILNDMYGGVCENPHLRITLALEVPNLKNTELQVGLNAFFNRYDGAYYYGENFFNPELGHYESDYISVDLFSHELGLEGALVKRLNIGNFLNLYGGVGTNLGYSIGDELNISGSNLQAVDKNIDRSNADIFTGTTYHDDNYHSFEAKDAFHQRVFIQAGVGFVLFKRVELGIDYRSGLGYKATFNGPTKGTRLNSIGVNTKWIL